MSETKTPNDATDYTWSCPHCVAVVVPWRVVLRDGSDVYHRREFCPCATGERARDEIEGARDEEKRRNQARVLIGNSNLDYGKYNDYRFANWDPRRIGTNAGDVGRRVSDYVSAISPRGRNWLYLHGEYGLGKTHLATAAVRKIAANKLWKPHRVVWTELCQATKESWGASSGASEAQLWGRTRGAAILLIDDLDKTVTSEWAMSKLFALVNYREMMQRPTIITANRSIKQLRRDWTRSASSNVHDAGLAVLSRIVGAVAPGNAVEFLGGDARWE